MISVTRLGYFWKALVTNFHSKIAQTSGNFLGYFEKYHLLTWNCCQFKANFWRNWATFISSSGRTGIVIRQKTYVWKNAFRYQELPFDIIFDIKLSGKSDQALIWITVA